MSDAPSQTMLLDCAVRAAIAGGTHALNNIHRRHNTIMVSKHDVKLELDVECQKVVERAILERYPDHSLLGEEDTGRSAPRGDSNFEWIIDPIDGTVNFTHGLPLWCCSVAVRRGEEVVAGAVYAPELGETYAATLDGPATRNGAAIGVSEVKTLAEAIVMTGLDKNAAPGARPLTMFEAISLNSRKTRIMGSAALDICFVASGRADGYFEAGIYIWDVAAAGLIVRSAGGQTEQTGTTGDVRLRFIATNGRIHAELRDVIRAARSHLKLRKNGRMEEWNGGNSVEK